MKSGRYCKPRMLMPVRVAFSRPQTRDPWPPASRQFLSGPCPVPGSGQADRAPFPLRSSPTSPTLNSPHFSCNVFHLGAILAVNCRPPSWAPAIVGDCWAGAVVMALRDGDAHSASLGRGASGTRHVCAARDGWPLADTGRIEGIVAGSRKVSQHGSKRAVGKREAKKWRQRRRQRRQTLRETGLSNERGTRQRKRSDAASPRRSVWNAWPASVSL